MPVTIRGGRVMFLQSQPGDGPQPVKKPPCESCGKPGHDFAPKWGSHIGNSTWLADAILAGRESAEHPWYTGERSIAAHHLVCSEAMADDERWARLCREFGYDINRPENGVMFPSRMDVACELHVPVHRGNHAHGWALDLDMAYPEAVKAKLARVAESVAEGECCANPLSLTRKLDKLSHDILGKVARGQWTLSSDGLDYQEGGVGCAGATSIQDKPRRMCTRKRKHSIVHGKTGRPLSARPLQVGA